MKKLLSLIALIAGVVSCSHTMQLAVLPTDLNALQQAAMAQNYSQGMEPTVLMTELDALQQIANIAEKGRLTKEDLVSIRKIAQTNPKNAVFIATMIDIGVVGKDWANEIVDTAEPALLAAKKNAEEQINAIVQRGRLTADDISYIKELIKTDPQAALYHAKKADAIRAVDEWLKNHNEWYHHAMAHIVVVGLGLGTLFALHQVCSIL